MEGFGGERQFPPPLIYNVTYVNLRVGGEIPLGDYNLEVVIKITIIASDPRNGEQYIIEVTLGTNFQVLTYRFGPIQFMG